MSSTAYYNKCLSDLTQALLKVQTYNDMLVQTTMQYNTTLYALSVAQQDVDSTKLVLDKVTKLHENAIAMEKHCRNLFNNCD